MNRVSERLSQLLVERSHHTTGSTGFPTQVDAETIARIVRDVLGELQ